MAQEYQPRRFFRNAPNLMLQRYFAAHNMLSDVDFGVLTETQVEPIYEAWLKLPDDARKMMEQDFQDIDGLATEGGSKAILDEARWHGEDLAEQFASLTGFHEHAFWTFFERPKYWEGALAFLHADAVPFSYWRKRKNVPRNPASVDALSIRQLEQSLSNYFATKDCRRTQAGLPQRLQRRVQNGRLVQARRLAGGGGGCRHSQR